MNSAQRTEIYIIKNPPQRVMMRHEKSKRVILLDFNNTHH
jgi:hypothetical protein